MKKKEQWESARAAAQRLADAYGTYPQVKAVALAGSFTSGAAGTGSDIDLYVYSDEELPLTARREVAEVSAGLRDSIRNPLLSDSLPRVEVNNQFWEPGDEWEDAASGIHVDVMFRSRRWVEDQVSRVVDQCEPSVGYSTCFWHNVKTSEILYDTEDWFHLLEAKADTPYPDLLVQRIVQKNWPLLTENHSSYLYQITRASQREDLVSLNHRVAALLASWFDIVLAVNRILHPGEKRLLAFTLRECSTLPDQAEADVRALLSAAVDPARTPDCVRSIGFSMETWLKEQGFLDSAV